MNNAAQPASRKRELLLLGFYLVLLIVAYGLGRYHDELLSWMTGEPLAALNRATAGVKPSDPELAAARALFEERRYDKARERLAQLAAAKPDQAETRYWLGRADYEMKQYADAVKHLNEAAKLDANLPDVYVHLALAYSALNDKKNLEESLKKALQ